MPENVCLICKVRFDATTGRGRALTCLECSARIKERMRELGYSESTIASNAADVARRVAAEGWGKLDCLTKQEHRERKAAPAVIKEPAITSDVAEGDTIGKFFMLVLAWRKAEVEATQEKLAIQREADKAMAVVDKRVKVVEERKNTFLRANAAKLESFTAFMDSQVKEAMEIEHTREAHKAESDAAEARRVETAKLMREDR